MATWLAAGKYEFSPRMWRCFSSSRACCCRDGIFSTYVEVFLLTSKASATRSNFLHVCGGVSEKYCELHKKAGFSPRMWRCFFHSHVSEGFE